ncbi:MAG: ElyC/SanA/YdcF family protein [Bacteroidota bacterium]
MRKSILILFSTLIFFFLLLVVNYYIISVSGKHSIFNNFAALPAYNNVLVFGAGRNYPSDRPNYAFTGRMAATEKLSPLSSVKKIILSGKNELPHYNEVDAMKTELIRRGVSEKKMVYDEDGVNTLQSLLNYKRDFGTEPVLMVSEREQLERALFYAEHLGINAAGYEATGFGKKEFQLREVLSRAKARIEVLF